MPRAPLLSLSVAPTVSGSRRATKEVRSHVLSTSLIEMSQIGKIMKNL